MVYFCVVVDGVSYLLMKKVFNDILNEGSEGKHLIMSGIVCQRLGPITAIYFLRTIEWWAVFKKAAGWRKLYLVSAGAIITWYEQVAGRRLLRILNINNRTCTRYMSQSLRILVRKNKGLLGVLNGEPVMIRTALF